MMPTTNKKHKAQVIHPLHQKSRKSIVLGEFFQKEFFDKMVVNMTSCAELDNDDDKASEE